MQWYLERSFHSKLLLALNLTFSKPLICVTSQPISVVPGSENRTTARGSESFAHVFSQNRNRDRSLDLLHQADEADKAFYESSREALSQDLHTRRIESSFAGFHACASKHKVR